MEGNGMKGKEKWNKKTGKRGKKRQGKRKLDRKFMERKRKNMEFEGKETY